MQSLPPKDKEHHNVSKVVWSKGKPVFFDFSRNKFFNRDTGKVEKVEQWTISKKHNSKK